MSPHEIDLLMHYYTCADDHENADHPGVRLTLFEMVANDLLETLPQPNEYGANWKLTERGEVYCDALTRVRLPVMRWVMPEAEA